MSYTFKQQLLDKSKYTLKCPYNMVAEEITIHNTANDASAENEANYHNRNNNATSYHVAIDHKEVIQVIPFNRNAFHAGDGGKGRGNRKAIGIEICYSKSGGERYKQAEENTVKYVAKLLKERNWNVSKVKKHQDYSGKYCPHRILDEGRWESFKERIAKELSVLNGEVDEKEMEELKAELKALKAKVSKLEEDSKKTGKLAEWAKESAKWAKESGISDGSRPDDDLTRQEAWKMLHAMNELLNK